jgi:hypothetical protein
MNTGKKTPGGAGTFTGHADTQRHTDRTDEPHNHPNPPTTHNPHVSATTEGEAAADSIPVLTAKTHNSPQHVNSTTVKTIKDYMYRNETHAGGQI